MFGIIAMYAVVPYFGTATILSGWFQEEENQRLIVHNWYAYDSVIQDYANYAYKLGGIDFVKLIECENGTWDPYRVSPTHDHWLCQLNYKFNKNFIGYNKINFYIFIINFIIWHKLKKKIIKY